MEKVKINYYLNFAFIIIIIVHFENKSFSWYQILHFIRFINHIKDVILDYNFIDILDFIKLESLKNC
jgi:hypothetical protein